MDVVFTWAMDSPSCVPGALNFTVKETNLLLPIFLHLRSRQIVCSDLTNQPRGRPLIPSGCNLWSDWIVRFLRADEWMNEFYDLTDSRRKVKLLHAINIHREEKIIWIRVQIWIWCRWKQNVTAKRGYWKHNKRKYEHRFSWECRVHIYSACCCLNRLFLNTSCRNFLHFFSVLITLYTLFFLCRSLSCWVTVSGFVVQKRPTPTLASSHVICLCRFTAVSVFANCSVHHVMTTHTHGCPWPYR